MRPHPLHTSIILVPQEMGYTPDFVQCLGPLLGQVKEQGLKVVANAGGINPTACVHALREAAKQAGVQLSVAMVTGDDLLGKVCLASCVFVCVSPCEFVERRGASTWSHGDGIWCPFTRQAIHKHERISGVRLKGDNFADVSCCYFSEHSQLLMH